MPIKKVQWYCKKCKAEFKTRDEAVNCEQSHYKIKRILWKKYNQNHKAPIQLHVEVDIGGTLKEVDYGLVNDGWGSK
jgi:hypothetical protein